MNRIGFRIVTNTLITPLSLSLSLDRVSTQKGIRREREREIKQKHKES